MALVRAAIVLPLLLLGACSAPAPAAVPTRAPTTAATTVAEPAAAPTRTTSAARVSESAAGQESYGEGGVDLYAQSAPEFPAELEWFNVSQPLSMAALRGKLVLIDFWTYGCVSCLHNIPDLKRLQAEYPNELVVIGVHSAKFTTEGESENIRRVIQRYELTYPVVNDRELKVWNRWGARAWPTTVLVDPLGTMAALHIGAGSYRVMKPLVVKLVNEADGRGRLDRTPLANLAVTPRSPSVLAFPAAVRADPAGGRLFIADTGNHRIVVADPASGEVLAVIGSGVRGLLDGERQQASFDTPRGMALTPDGRTLYVADTGNHALRAVDLASGRVTTIAGNGARALKPQRGAQPALESALSSPWDLALGDGRLFVAMAGLHQVWALDLRSGLIGPFAGSATEGVADGPLAEAELAQPSALALDARGTLFFADTESSSVRSVTLGAEGAVQTLAGGGGDLFAFGDADATGRAARFQHPQGLAFADGALLVADTYNHKIKRIDPATGAVQTLFGAGQGWRDGTAPLFYEPAGIDVAGGTLFVADANNHAVRIVELETGAARTLVLKGIERFTPRPDEVGYRGTTVRLDPAVVAAGAGEVRLDLELPAGYKINEQAPSSVAWRSTGATLPPDADRALAGLRFPLVLPATFESGAGEVIADLTLIYCEAETPDLCLIDEVRLVAPFVADPTGSGTLALRHEVVLPALPGG